jgi:ABC-2 type transport system permease protein
MTALTTPLVPSRPRLGLPATGAIFVKRSLIHSLRTPDALIMAIVLPVILMLLFTFVFGGALDRDGSYVNYVVPGIVLLCAGFGAATVAVDVAQDMTTGIVDRFRTMPIAASAVIAGHVVASVVRNAVATAVVIGVALAVGFRPTASPLAWLGVAGLVVLYILAITFVFAGIGIVSSSPEAANGYGFVLMFLPYVSSAFVPVDTMPVWLRSVAQHQPLTPIIETLRSLLLGTPLGSQGWWAIGWCVVILAAAIAWSTALFARRAGRR